MKITIYACDMCNKTSKDYDFLSANSIKIIFELGAFMRAVMKKDLCIDCLNKINCKINEVLNERN